MEEKNQGAQVVAPWDGTCQRCGEETNTFTMSWFTTESICMDCSDEENNHPDIKVAKAVESAHVKAGNYNYPGIGWPGNEKRVILDISALYPSTVLSYPIDEE